MEHLEHINSEIQRDQIETNQNFTHLVDKVYNSELESLKSEIRSIDRLNFLEGKLSSEIKYSTEKVLDRLTFDKVDSKNDEIQSLRFKELADKDVKNDEIIALRFRLLAEEKRKV